MIANFRNWLIFNFRLQVYLALLLKQRKVIFNLTIYGAGELKDDMITFIKNNQLDNIVFMPGPVDFYNKLLPELQKNIDLFVCLHRQSDPSCTYLETLSCGIPIVGYKNRAFSGLLNMEEIGWAAKINDLKKIADIIENLNKNRNQICEKSKIALRFARQNDFETTFQNRINQLKSLL